MRFTKMHGIGNDYVYIDGFREHVADPSALAVHMSRPHFGVGSDGLILILPSERADFRMRMFNKDGSEGKMCGNGARCVGRFVYEHGLTDQTRFTLETGGGVREIELFVAEGRVDSVRVDMGAPQMLKVEEGHTLVSMGNRNAVLLMDRDPFAWPEFESVTEPLCARLDANIVCILPLSRQRLRMRVFERGSGETLACGSGACAALVAAHTSGLTGRSAVVSQRGGDLSIEWRETDGHVLMTGPAETVFEGEWPKA